MSTSEPKCTPRSGGGWTIPVRCPSCLAEIFAVFGAGRAGAPLQAAGLGLSGAAVRLRLPLRETKRRTFPEGRAPRARAQRSLRSLTGGHDSVQIRAGCCILLRLPHYSTVCRAALLREL